MTDAFSGSRTIPTGGKREPEYWCHRCKGVDRKWRAGGASELGRHQIIHRGIEAFPAFQLIDGEGYVLDFEGSRLRIDRKAVRASTAVTGWVRTRLLIMGPLAHDRDGTR